ncbi:unnamed protein product [Durusdinium trenchii]
MQGCRYPRYTWLDMLYELLFREQCMLLLMADAGTFANLDKECYSVFRERLKMCAKVAAQCLILAIGLGAIIVADSRPLGKQLPDEATMLAEARAEEMTKTSGAYDRLEHRCLAELKDR